MSKYVISDLWQQRKQYSLPIVISKAQDALNCCFLTIHFTLCLAKTCCTSVQHLPFENIYGKRKIKKISQFLYFFPVWFLLQNVQRQMLLLVVLNTCISDNRLCLNLFSSQEIKKHILYTYNNLSAIASSFSQISQYNTLVLL